MRRSLAAVLTLALAGCGTFTTTTSFRAVDDLHTTQPRSLAEGGHSQPVTPPPGVAWVLGLSSVEERPLRGMPASYYELRVMLADRVPDSDPGRIKLVLQQAALVDDEGRGFAPREVLLVESEPPPVREDGQPPPPREYILPFDVPNTYRFGHTAHVTFHWGLQIGEAPVLHISSRFRR